MKVAVFGTKKHDIDSFAAVDPDSHGIELKYLEANLDTNTAPLANGYDAVCIFVNDVCDREVLEQLKKQGVKFIALRCAGYNNVDLEVARELGLKVVNVPAYSPESVAEFAVGMIMTVVRKYHKAYLRVREGNFLLDGLLGFNLKDKIVGIVGTGRIGLLTGRILAKGFGCYVIAYDPYPNEHAGEYGITYADSLDDLLERADIISLHCPLNEGTKYMINDKTLSKTKKGVVLVNTSRGGLIDTHALIRALKSGHLGAVGLDVYEKEASYFFKDSSSKIIQDDNFARLLSFYVFISGHQAFLTNEALKGIAEATIRNLQDLEKDVICVNEVKHIAGLVE